MSALIGTRTQHTAGDDTLADRTALAANESGVILGLYLACDGVADEVVFTDGAGTVLATLASVVDGTASIEVPFLVGKGFIVGAALATSFITVIYRPGA